MNPSQEYSVKKCSINPSLKGCWEGKIWQEADILDVANFHPSSSGHRPKTQAKLLYDDRNVYGIFNVQDNYVRCVGNEFQDPVCRDSCVEFFFNPAGVTGYFNFEINCGGTLLAHYHPAPIDSKTSPCIPLTSKDADSVCIYHSLPSVIDPEITVPTEWIVEFSIPFSLLSKYAGEINPIEGSLWRANLYKCADACSHPHWSSWKPAEGDVPNFHQPDCFGIIHFAPPLLNT